ncbi:Electron transport complex protein RnfE [hydrothermal vent metagenome]|uniref:Electron transport complex protein RnfE n=1 Tax=hydrothermal vent metagenome TaxID=652676 RepID=A0A3B0RBG2_9ZZZZ
MANKKTLSYEFVKGLWRENTVIKMLLGMCPTLAVTNSASNGLAMGLASTFVVVASAAMVSLIRRLVPGGVRIPTYIIIIAAFVTLAELFLKAYFPVISKSLGPYVPLIVVNCMIMGRAEFFASKNPVTPAVVDALGTGIGFTWVLVLLGAIREILGSGSIFGIVLMTDKVFTPWVVMVLPAGAFLSLGLMIGIINYFTLRRRRAA